MKIEFLVDPKFARDDVMVFDFQEFEWINDEKSVIEEELAEYFDHICRREEEIPVILLLRRTVYFSIVDLFIMSLKVAGELSCSAVQFVIGSEGIRDYLENQIPPIDTMREEFLLKNYTVILATGDISEVEADAIVNASNTRLVLGAGVSGAISAKAGASLQTEMSAIAARKTPKAGDAVITSSHSLAKCRYIIHAATVEGSPETVSMAVQNCLAICMEKRIACIAFPALGTGTGGLGIEVCAKVMIETLMSFYRKDCSKLYPKTVIFILWTKSSFSVFLETFRAALNDNI
ncbi:MAG: hypothetical protein EHM85_02875 [Desulfobacteraceae bacterium]|nr:MAG: hypothetical protein EHM85_02875 [Desulfobacteraceae bacterium]